MSKTLLLGPPGSGKTHELLARFAQAVRDGLGEQTLILLPSHQQIQNIQQLLIKHFDLSGFFTANFVTFFDLARQIAAPSPPERQITLLERDYLVGKLLAEIPAFQHLAGLPGFRNQAADLIKEFKDALSEPPQLEMALQAINQPKEQEYILEKREAIATLYKRYQEEFAERSWWDFEGLTWRALDRLRIENTFFEETSLLLVDGFYTYTPLQLALLKELVHQVPEVFVTLTFAEDRHKGTAYARITKEQLLACGLVEETLTDNHRTSRASLLHLSENLFVSNSKRRTEPEVIQILGGASKENEIELVAREILSLVKDGKTRYEEILVIIRHPSAYREEFESVFGQFGIPVAITARHGLTESPVTQAALQLLVAIKSGWCDEEVLAVLKNDWFGIERPQPDQLAYELLGEGRLDSKERWVESVSTNDHVSLRGVVNTLASFDDGASRPLREWAARFLELIRSLITPTPLTWPPSEELQRRIRVEHKARTTLEHLLEGLASLLEEVEETCDVTTFSCRLRREFRLAAFEMPKPQGEAVRVMDPFHARHLEADVVIICGLLEKSFPILPRENLFISDEERQRLTGHDLHLKTTTDRQNEERYIFSIAVSLARDRLVLTYPAFDPLGNPTLPSFFLDEVKRCFTEEAKDGWPFQQVRNPAQVVPEPSECHTLSDAGRLVLSRLNDSYTLLKEPKGVYADAILGLYRWLLNEEGFRYWLKGAVLTQQRLNAVGQKAKFTNKALLDWLTKHKRNFSASRLKDYALCPFRFFATGVLGLKESELEQIFDNLISGTIAHEALHRYYKETKGKGDLLAIFEEVFEENTRGIVLGYREERVRQEMRFHLEQFQEYEQTFATQYSTKPKSHELEFGLDAEKPLVFDLPDNGEVRIRGRIDRIDSIQKDGRELGVVIDYKFSSREFGKDQADEIQKGVDLQLPLYMLAAREIFGIEPIAAEFYSLKKGTRGGIIRPAFVEQELIPDDGKKHTIRLAEDEVEGFFQTIKEQVSGHVREIHDGHCGITPRENACTFCDVHDVCRYEVWLDPYRREEG